MVYQLCTVYIPKLYHLTDIISIPKVYIDFVLDKKVQNFQYIFGIHYRKCIKFAWEKKQCTKYVPISHLVSQPYTDRSIHTRFAQFFCDVQILYWNLDFVRNRPLSLTDIVPNLDIVFNSNGNYAICLSD